MEHGNIKIENDKDEYRIDVIAESGTVRTYIIRLNNIKKTNNNEEQENENMLIEEPDKLKESNVRVENKKVNHYNHINYVIGITIFIAVLFIFIITKMKIKKGKHNK